MKMFDILRLIQMHIHITASYMNEILDNMLKNIINHENNRMKKTQQLIHVTTSSRIPALKSHHKTPTNCTL